MGGGKQTTTTNSYDPEATKLQREIANWQMARADEQHDFYKEYFRDFEKQQVESNKRLLPLIEKSSTATMNEQMRDLEKNQVIKDKMRNVQLAQMDQHMDELGHGANVSRSFYKQALEGVNVGQRMREAQADVALGFKQAQAANVRNASRMGLNPNSGRFASQMRQSGLDQARAFGAARAGARNQAQAENFSRLGAAMSARRSMSGLPGIQSFQGNNTQQFATANVFGRGLAASQAASATNSVLANRVMSSTTTEKKKLGLADVAGAASAIGGMMAM